MTSPLEGRRALVTGASRGIGREIALALARAGADVAVLATNETLLSEVVRDIETAGRKALAVKTDVSSTAEIEAAVKKVVEAFGTIDILVNNAGITKDNLLMLLSEDDWDRVLTVNLKASFTFIKHVSKVMLRQRRGSIINIASVAGIMGNPGQANYSASKGGLIALTKTAARELASRTIRVNAVAPGFIQTEMSAKVNEETLKKAVEGIPLKRIGQAREVADAVVFLSSDAASYITGQVLSVDGGMVM